MALFKKITLGLGFVLLLCVFFYKTILSFLVINYLNAQGISLSFEFEKLSFNQIAVQNVRIQNKTIIRRFELITSSFWQKPLQIKKMDFQAKTIDLESLHAVFEKMRGASQDTDANDRSPNIVFSDLLEHCQQINTLPLSVQIDEISWGDIKLPLKLKTKKIDKQIHLSWNDPERSHGSVFLQCDPDAVFLQAPEIFTLLQNVKLKEQKVEYLKIHFQNAFAKWHRNSFLQLALPGEASVVTTENKVKKDLHLPSVVLSAQSHLDQPQKIEVRLLAKRLSLATTHTIDIPYLESVNHIDVASSDLKVRGHLSLKDAKILGDKISPLLQGLNSLINYTASTQDYQMQINFSDKNKLLRLKNITINGSLKEKEHSVSLNHKDALIVFKSEIVELIPLLKPYLRSLSGQLSLGGKVVYKNENLKGFIEIKGRDISSQSEFGSFTDLNFSHSIVSFKNWASPADQILQIKKIEIGPGLENLKIQYQVINPKKISVQSLSFNYGQATFTSNDFMLNLLQKRVDNFVLKISNLDLQRVLALGLKTAVTAQGRLDGQVRIHFPSHRPTLTGELADSNPGHIQYRTGGSQASSLSISDNPMDILNNYLYDFYYSNLSLQISTDEKYDMKMTLSAWGHNPGYLGGKPLKLNVNLEQNLLAAVQSMMLTYDLPSKLKEKIEKAEQ